MTTALTIVTIAPPEMTPTARRSRRFTVKWSDDLATAALRAAAENDDGTCDTPESDEPLTVRSWKLPNTGGLWPDTPRSPNFPDEDAPWVWPDDRPWVHHGDVDDRNINRTLRLFGREVLAYNSVRSAPGWFRDIILSRWGRRS